MIDERAIIDPNARIGNDVSIGPWSSIGPDVEIGDGTIIESHVVIKGPTRIGKNNHIFQFCSLGERPQALKYDGEHTVLEIGDNNVIREFCTLHRGTVHGGGMTRVGNHNFLMSYVHVAHDCIVGSHVIFANNAALSGHVIVEDYANFGGFSAVHQHCKIGAYCFVSGATSVVKDVPPFILISGHPASVYGLNVVGLKRHGFNDKTLSILRRAYSVIYRQGNTAQQAIRELEKLVHDCKEVQQFIDALNKSTRGIVR